MDSEEDSYEYDSETESSKPRLNMNHGFIHHIRRNQIDRDNYDKRVKSEKGRSKRQRSNQKAENKLYVPPKYKDTAHEGTISDDESTSVAHGKLLFKLEYTANSGKIHSLHVRKGHDPNILAKKLVKEAEIPRDLLETLQWKIKQEQIKKS